MCAAQLDELPESDEPVEKSLTSGGGNLVPALIAIVLAPALYSWCNVFLDQSEQTSGNYKTSDHRGRSTTQYGTIRRGKVYELSQLITNLGGPIKSRYINLDLKLEGLAGDFEKILEPNHYLLPR